MNKKALQLKLWMLIILGFLVFFLIIRFIVSYIDYTDNQDKFTINPLDEQVIYKGVADDMTDQSNFLPKVESFK